MSYPVPVTDLVSSAVGKYRAGSCCCHSDSLKIYDKAFLCGGQGTVR